MVCFGRLGSAQYADLCGPDASVPTTAPAPANCPPAAASSCGRGSASGTAATAMANARILNRILEESDRRSDFGELGKIRVLVAISRLFQPCRWWILNTLNLSFSLC
jgi:hypothetical protein